MKAQIINQNYRLLPGSHFAILAAGHNDAAVRIELKHSDVAPNIVTVEVFDDMTGERICLPEYIQVYRTIPSKYGVPGLGQEF